MIDALILTALTTLTLLECFRKWGWIDLYAAYRKAWMPEATCALCLSFWLSIIVGGVYALLNRYGIAWLMLPFAVAGALNAVVTLLNVLRNENHQP